MKKETMYSNLIRMKDKFIIDGLGIPYGLMCSEKTKSLLSEHCKDISGMSFLELNVIHELKIRTHKFFPNDVIWLLNKEDFEGFDKGIVPTAERIIEMR